MFQGHEEVLAPCTDQAQIIKRFAIDFFITWPWAIWIFGPHHIQEPWYLKCPKIL